MRLLYVLWCEASGHLTCIQAVRGLIPTNDIMVYLSLSISAESIVCPIIVACLQHLQLGLESWGQLIVASVDKCGNKF